MTEGERIPGVDPYVASPARVYDYMLGGKDHFAVDRELAERLLARAPLAGWNARQNRAFLGRAVRYCAEQGIRQFLDLGSGLPTQENVHQVAQRVDPGCRVVYIDHDPVVTRHAQALLAGGQGVSAVSGDIRRPREIFVHDEVRRLIDFSEPVVVLMVAIVHFVTDDEDPAGIVRAFTDVMVPGGHLVLTHATHDLRPEDATSAKDLYRHSSSQLATRTKEEVAAFFAGFDLVEPGLVKTTQWRPAEPIPNAEDSTIYAGVARKPAARGPEGPGGPDSAGAPGG